MNVRERMLERIRANIEQFGHHVYLVAGQQLPRFVYTIGVSARKGAELIAAGGALFSNGDVQRITELLAASTSDLSEGVSMDGPPGTGSFSLRKVDSSWARLLIRGAMDYYKRADVAAMQVVPDKSHWTLDIPDLGRTYDPAVEPAWRWLTESWEFPIAKGALAVTNLDALRGAPITEAVRWEVDQWELFAGAGPDVPKDEIREVPFGTLLALDGSLHEVVALDVGKGLWRDPADLKWHKWERQAQ